VITEMVAWLQAQTAISNSVGTRIYPQKLPQRPTLPALTYSQVSAVRVRDLSGPAYKSRTRVSFSCWANTELAAHQLADALRQTLDDFYGTSWGNVEVGHISLDNEFDLFEEEAGTVGIYRVVQDYIIAHLEV
jgi:hypothetical protein